LSEVFLIKMNYIKITPIILIFKKNNVGFNIKKLIYVSLFVTFVSYLGTRLFFEVPFEFYSGAFFVNWELSPLMFFLKASFLTIILCLLIFYSYKMTIYQIKISESKKNALLNATDTTLVRSITVTTLINLMSIIVLLYLVANIYKMLFFTITHFFSGNFSL